MNLRLANFLITIENYIDKLESKESLDKENKIELNLYKNFQNGLREVLNGELHTQTK